MKVSMKGDYGVRALVELAHHYGEGPVQSAVIASRQCIPEPYLDQLLTSLRRAGFIRSVRGPQGGHALISDPRELRLSEAIGALEGSLAPIACLDDPNGCRRHAKLLSQARSGRRSRRKQPRILQSITIADLAERERAGVSFPIRNLGAGHDRHRQVAASPPAFSTSSATRRWCGSTASCPRAAPRSSPSSRAATPAAASRTASRSR